MFGKSSDIIVKFYIHGQNYDTNVAGCEGACWGSEVPLQQGCVGSTQCLLHWSEEATCRRLLAVQSVHQPIKAARRSKFCTIVAVPTDLSSYIRWKQWNSTFRFDFLTQRNLNLQLFKAGDSFLFPALILLIKY